MSTTFMSFDQLFSNRRLTEYESMYISGVLSFDTEFKEIQIPEEPPAPYTNEGESDCEDGFAVSVVSKNKKVLPYNKQLVVTAFGRFGDVPVTLHILDFHAHFYVKVPKQFAADKTKTDDYFKKFRFWAYSKTSHTNIPQKHKDIHFTMELIQKIDSDGFTNNTYTPFIKMTFKNSNTFKKYYNLLKNSGNYSNPIPIKIAGEPVKLYEGRCYPYMKFFHGTRLLPVGNWTVNNFVNVPTEYKQARTPIEILAFIDNIIPGPQAVPSSIVSMAFDIETAPLISEALHPILAAHDPIIAMPVSFKVADKVYNYIPMYLGTANEDPETDGYTIIPCKTESELILTFVNFLRYGPYYYDKSISPYMIPDLTLSYNGNGYDWNYIGTRAKELDIFIDLSKSSKLLDFPSKLISKNLTSSGLGKNDFIYMQYPGIINIDLLQYIKKQNDVELPDLKLDTVARQYLSKKDRFASKIDSGAELFEILRGKELSSFKDSPNYGILKKVFILYKDLETIKSLVDYLDLGSNQEIDQNSNKGLNQVTINWIKMYKLIFDTVNHKISTEESKYDLPYFTMYEYIRKARDSTEDEEAKAKAVFYTTEIAKYSIQDCVLLHKLDKAKMITLATLSSANINKILWKTIFICGSGVPIYSVVCEFANKKDKLLPDRHHDEKAYKALFTTAINKEGTEWYDEYKELHELYDGDKLIKKLEKLEERFYEFGVIAGGFVKPPIPGLHRNVATLDVNSEYPSIMRTHNLSFDTIVLDPEYDNLPGLSYTTHEWETIDGTVHTSRFVCDYTGHSTDGVLPEVLEYQINARSSVRKLQKKVSADSQEYATLEAQQLAIKVLCNSTYGTMVDLRSRLQCKAIGGCTTALSRAYIKECARLVLEWFSNAEIVYGDTDSFFVKFTHYNSEFKLVTDPQEALTLAWNDAKTAENKINEYMQGQMYFMHMKIELEKVFSILLLYDKKKKYFGKLHKEPQIGLYEVKTMGVKHKKRDSSPIEKFIGSYIEELTIAEKYEKMFPFVHATIKAILRGDFDISYFKKSCKYNPPYKNPRGTMGYVIQDIIKSIDPGNAPQVGQRMFYTYCKFPENAGKSRYKIKKTEIAYPADYITDQQIEYSIYIEHFLKNIEHILNIADKIESNDRLTVLKKIIRTL